MKASDIKGVLVKKVEKIGPARKAGIRIGDIILAIGTRDILSVENYHTVMKGFPAEETIDISLWRDGKGRTVSVQSSAFPKELALDLAYSLMGVAVENLSKKNRYINKPFAKEGVLISEIHRQSFLSQIGVRPGDIIRQMDDVTIKNIKDFENAIIKYRQKSSVVILLQRGNQLYNITVKL